MLPERNEWQQALTLAGFGNLEDVAHPVMLWQAAQILWARNQRSAAEAIGREFVRRQPNDLPGCLLVAQAVQWRGDLVELAQWRRRIAELEAARLQVPAADRPEVVAFWLACQGYGALPAQAPAAHVIATFNEYAHRFDHHLREQLQYRVPELAFAAVRQLREPGARLLDILDIGCGTGLGGSVFRPLARRLDGVDLSPGMLAKARERGLYDQLDEGDLLAAMSARPATYDLITAFDVFLYVGELQPVFAAAAVTLRPGGLVAFSIERGDEPGYQLGASKRYVHELGWLREQWGNAFDALAVQEVTLRIESEQPVAGYVIVLRRHSSG